MPIINSFDYLFPILIGKSKENTMRNFLGTGFFIKEMGIFLTARHVLDIHVPKDLELIASLVQPNGGSITFTNHRIKQFKFHPQYDISVGQLEGITDNKYFEFDGNEQLSGNLVATYGFGDTKDNDTERTIEFNPRFFTGCITRISKINWMGMITPSLELPFPVLTGASGSPILDGHTRQKVVGVAYGNHKSKIFFEQEQEEMEVVTPDGARAKKIQTFSEFQNFGLAHTSESIQQVLKLIDPNWLK